MRRYVGVLWTGVAAIVLAVLGGGSLVALSGESSSQQAADFDWDLYQTVYKGYVEHALSSVDDLVLEYEWDQLQYLPVIPPGPPDPLHVGWNRSTMIYPKSFPGWFINGLVPVTRTIEGRSYVAYPVWIQEDAKTRDRVIYAADDTVIARISPPKDYDPYWLLNDGLGGIAAVQDNAYDEWMRAVFDPARIIGHFDLVTEDAVMVLAAAAATPSLPGGGMAMMMSGEDASNLCFIACDRYGTNGAVELTLAWPEDFSNNVSIITCTNLVVTNWSFLMTTNLPTTTNTLTFVDTNSCNSSQQFYHAYNADISSATDGDQDGIVSAAEEYVLGTDPDDGDDPPNISGLAQYLSNSGSGGQTGTCYVALTTSAGSTNYVFIDTASGGWPYDGQSSQSVPYTNAPAGFGSVVFNGWFHLTNVTTGSYYITTWIDADADGAPDTYEPVGPIYRTNSITIDGQESGNSVLLYDPDTDSDGMGDWWEVAYFDDLLETNSTDYDGDKLSNLLEYETGTDPTTGFVDDDNDGMSSDWEQANGLDNQDPSDADEDPDLDGFTNWEEFDNNGSTATTTDPNDALSHPSGAVYVDTEDGSDSTGNGSYTNAFASISNAFDEVAGGRVLLFPGTYSGSTNRNLLYPASCRMLVGIEGMTETIIDCEGSNHAFVVSQYNTDGGVRGITFKNGQAQDGGAIQCKATDFLVKNCSFVDNTAVDYGGAIEFRNCRAAITNCSFASNHAANGAAIAVYKSGGTPSLDVGESVFESNAATNYGGAIHLYSGSLSVELRNCRITDNSAGSGGAAVMGPGGTAILEIESSTIADNLCPAGGTDAAVRDFGGAMSVLSSIVWGNTPAQIGDPASATVQYCDIEDWTNGGTGNIAVDPAFADSSEYLLKPASPCRNAGTNETWMTGATDLFGRPRILNGITDMGAYELNVYLVDEGNPGAASPYASWATAAATIQDAIGAAANIDPIILVTNGVYSNGTVSVDGSHACRVALTNAVTVMSVNGHSNTVIAGQGPLGASAVRCAYIGSGSRLSGFTLTNGHTRAEGIVETKQGGGVWCATGGAVENCLIIGNAAADGDPQWGYGGAVYGGKAIGCLIVSNSASDGGATYGTALESCTVVSNVTYGSQTETAVENGTVLNSIIYYNTGGNMTNSTATYSCVTPLPSGTGNTSDDPDFVDAAAGDYRLDSGSPCIDAGTNQAWMVDALDLDGNSRIQDGTVDMGAYEW